MDREASISRWLRRRRMLRAAAFSILGLILLSVVLDRAGAFGSLGSDAGRFDHKSVIVTRAIDGDTICVQLPGDSRDQTVHLLGVDAPSVPASHWSANAAKYTAARTVGRTVTVRLDPIGWRNDRGELLAYVFVTDADNLNVDMIHDGQAYADRRVQHSLHALFEAAEKEARQKKRGLWKDLSDEQMPQWRRDWLRSRGY